jgi:[ribosomal protein S18]-alanine N-acetyltransferase
MIRILVSSDLEPVKAIDRDTFGVDDQYDDIVYEQIPASGVSFVAEDRGVAVGYVFAQIDSYVRVRSIAVRPQFRRRGHARELLRAVIARADRDVDLLVDPDNEPAIGLYRSLGFEPGEADPNVPARQRLVLTMKRPRR